jgi:hypothetical protein
MAEALSIVAFLASIGGLAAVILFLIDKSTLRPEMQKEESRGGNQSANPTLAGTLSFPHIHNCLHCTVRSRIQSRRGVDHAKTHLLRFGGGIRALVHFQKTREKGLKQPPASNPPGG